MDLTSTDRPLGPAPKARICYVCGRQYMLHSFDIHIKQCKELFLAREAQKDPRDRKKLPEDPLEKLAGSGIASPGTFSHEDASNFSPAGRSSTASPMPGLDPSKLTRKELEELNKLSNDTYNTETLSTCAYCGRTFLPEKLVIHNRSCTADNPARKVAEKIRKGAEVPTVSGINEDTIEKTPARPKTTNSKVRTPSTTDQSHDSTPSLKVVDGALVGHLGGSAGRNIRSNGKGSSTKDSRPPSSLSPAPPIGNLEEKSKDEVISLLTNRLDFMESTVFDLSQSLGEMRAMLSRLKEN